MYIKKKILTDGHPCLTNKYNNLANLHYYQHEYEEALESYKLSYESFKKSLTSRHPSVARVLRNIGIAYEVTSNFIEAKYHYEKAINIFQLILNSNHPDLIEYRKYIQRVLQYNLET